MHAVRMLASSRQRTASCLSSEPLSWRAGGAVAHAFQAVGGPEGQAGAAGGPRAAQGGDLEPYIIPTSMLAQCTRSQHGLPRVLVWAVDAMGFDKALCGIMIWHLPGFWKRSSQVDTRYL